MDLLFDCVDLDRNDCMEFNEFIGLYKYIENVTDYEQLQEVKHLFLKETNIMTSHETNEKAFNKDQFVEFVIKNNWFSIFLVEKFSKDI